MSLALLQPSFLMSKTRSYAKIFIGSRLFLTAMAIHLSLRVAPLDLQQGGNSRIPYVHVPTARMSILVYIATAINTFLFLLTKHPLFLRSFGTGTEMGAFSTLFTLVTGGFRGRPMWGTFSDIYPIMPILVYVSKVDGKFNFSPISVKFLTEGAKVIFALVMLLIQDKNQKIGEKPLLSVSSFVQATRNNVLLVVPARNKAFLYAFNYTLNSFAFFVRILQTPISFKQQKI
ncbi:putative cytochrome c biosynthesis ccmC-like mitochondrial protein [Lactuca sativa]|uniref:putative cytochrome c biosynthesis ccmC-like mitochondrial protein n=1 Tax=Lactuca sativa TaxID=4236 RepID=UPI001C692CBF|nr:putative cytochrome c biosynthesis ccmC-like mitochondrial protein [Lactuca sativa]